MGWKGIAFGGWIGGALGGPLGAIVGAAIGGKIENAMRSPGRRPYSTAAKGDSAMVFCASAAAMLAKMAKADGRITSDEIESVEAAFARLGFSGETRRFAIDAFRRAKDDAHSIYEYAEDFAGAVRGVEARTIFYGLLWDLACADGVVTRGEDRILREITRHLGIAQSWYFAFARERLSGGGADGGSVRRDALAEAYSILGILPSATDDDAKRAYRDMAKKYHPDSLRSQGLPEEMVAKATGQMAKINSAWAEIRKARGI